MWHGGCRVLNRALNPIIDQLVNCTDCVRSNIVCHGQNSLRYTTRFHARWNPIRIPVWPLVLFWSVCFGLRTGYNTIGIHGNPYEPIGFHRWISLGLMRGCRAELYVLQGGAKCTYCRRSWIIKVFVRAVTLAASLMSKSAECLMSISNVSTPLLARDLECLPDPLNTSAVFSTLLMTCWTLVWGGFPELIVAFSSSLSDDSVSTRDLTM
jgi:hypothetical protein